MSDLVADDKRDSNGRHHNDDQNDGDGDNARCSADPWLAVVCFCVVLLHPPDGKWRPVYT